MYLQDGVVMNCGISCYGDEKYKHILWYTIYLLRNCFILKKICYDFTVAWFSYVSQG